MLKVGWFSTGRGPGSRGLLQFIQRRIERGLLDASISFVFCNREWGEAEGSDTFFRLVDGFRLPLVTLSSRRFARERGGRFVQCRSAYDLSVRDLLQGYDLDVCMLAGYMLIVGPELWRHWPMLNLHPALPDGPKGTWQDVIWQLVEARATHTGAMVHLANDDLDRGPVVAYFTLPITGPDFRPLWDETAGMSVEGLRQVPGEDLPLFQRIREEGYLREPYLIAETLQALAQGKVSVRHGTVRDAEGKLVQGVCLDAEIEAELRGQDKGRGAASA